MSEVFNAPLAKKLLEWLEEHQEWNGGMLYHQKVWAAKADCGTALCAAGATVWLAAGEFSWAGYNSTSEVELASLPEEIREGSRGVMGIPQAAQALLGIDRDTAWSLWASHNSLDDIKAILVPLIEKAERAL